MVQYVDYQVVADIFEAMRVEAVDGLTVSDMVGGGYPLPIAIHVVDLLVDQAGLARGDRVLDVGCGCGRVAAALTQHIGAEGWYRGVDIVAGLVDFANRHIAARFGNFSFFTLERENPAYDHWRHEGHSPVVSSLGQVCPAGEADLCIATSLFTHLDSAMARQMLHDVAAALHSNGRCLVTLFLIDAGTRALIAAGRAAFQFEHHYGEGTFVQDPSGPLGAIAYTYEHFINLLTEQGLYVERLLHGSWSGRPNFVSGQDVLIIRKTPADMLLRQQAAFAAGRQPMNSVQLADDNRRLAAEVDAFRESTSWRLTRPLRALSRMAQLTK